MFKTATSNDKSLKILIKNNKEDTKLIVLRILKRDISADTVEIKQL